MPIVQCLSRAANEEGLLSECSGLYISLIQSKAADHTHPILSLAFILFFFFFFISSLYFLLSSLVPCVTLSPQPLVRLLIYIPIYHLQYIFTHIYTCTFIQYMHIYIYVSSSFSCFVVSSCRAISLRHFIFNLVNLYLITIITFRYILTPFYINISHHVTTYET